MRAAESDQALVDMFDDLDSNRVRLRLAWQRRVETKGHELALPAEGARPRSLPSGPAPSWTGLALSLGLLAVSAVGLSAAVVGFVAVNAAQNAWSAIRGGQR